MPVEAPPAPAASPAPPAAPSKPSPGASRPSTFRGALEKIAGSEPKELQPEKPDLTPGKPEKPADAKPQDTKSGDKPSEKPDVTDKAVPHGTKSEKPKINPWNELKVERQRAAQLEQQLSEVKKSITPDNDRTVLGQRMETIQKENEELRNRIRFKDFEASPEFKEKFHKPYEEALDMAMETLERIPITGADGQQRAANQADLFEIVQLLNTNLGEAKRRSTDVFGELAPEVMAMANDVRKTLAARNKALSQEQKNGQVREQQMRENIQKAETVLIADLESHWKRANEAIAADPEMAEFLKPKEIPGGQSGTPEEIEHNRLVEKGNALADKAFKLAGAFQKKKFQTTPEERAEAAKYMAALRNRSTAFGVVRPIIRKLKAENAKLKADLDKYQATIPSAGGRQPNGAPKTDDDFKTGLRQTLKGLSGVRH